MRHHHMHLYPDSGTHWSVGRGGTEPGVAKILREQHGRTVPTDEKGGTEFVLIQLGEERPQVLKTSVTDEQIRLMFTVQEAKWLIDAIKDTLDSIKDTEVAIESKDYYPLPLEEQVPQPGPVVLPPPDLSKINLDIPE